MTTSRAYVSDSASHTVSVIDTVENKVTATIPVGTAPVNPTFTSDGSQVFVSNSQAGTLSVIDVATESVTTTIDAGGPKPSGLAFTPDGTRLVVTLLGETVETEGSVRVMDLATGELSPPVTLGGQPERIALSPDTTRAYIVNLGGRSMSVVDIDRGEVVATILLGDTAFNLLVSPDGSRVYVGNVRADFIGVVDTGTHELVSRIEVPSPNGMAFGLDRASMYVTNVFAGTIQEIDLASEAVKRSAEVGEMPGFVSLTPDGQSAYFVRPYGSTVSVLDTATLEIVDTIPVGDGPSVITIYQGS